MTFVSYSQNCEDVLLWRALQDVEAGFYIDVGAADPEEYSVTSAFYERGWSGINIEPLGYYHDRLEQARPRDTNLRVALGACSGLVPFHVVPQTGLSTVDGEIAGRHARNGWEVEVRVVPQLTLTEIMSRRGSAPIHFLKIDVEGAERAVLEGCDLRRFRPWVVVVEATSPLLRDDARAGWEDILLEQGYAFAIFDGLNGFYVAQERPDILSRLRVPANVFDDYMRVSEHRALTELAANRRQHHTGSSWAGGRIAAGPAADAAHVVAGADGETSLPHRDQDAHHPEQPASEPFRALDASPRGNAVATLRAAELSALRLQHEQLQDEQALLAFRLEATLSSHSWRLTAPARRLSGALRDSLRYRPRLTGGRSGARSSLSGLARQEVLETGLSSLPQDELSRTVSIVLDGLRHHLRDEAVA